MGGKSGQTVGWHYLIAKLLSACKGPIDTLLEIRGGEKTAWSGEQSTSGTISINAPNLWGGEKGEGGIVGDVDVMMGEASQTPSAYMAAKFSAAQPARRGLFGLLFKGGKYGALSPYAPQKLPSAKVRRILKGWDGDACWYPAKAGVPYGEIAGETTELVNGNSAGWTFLQVANTDLVDHSAGITGGATGGQTPFANTDSSVLAGAAGGWPLPRNHEWDANTHLWLQRQFDAPGGAFATLGYFVDNYISAWVNGTLVRSEVETGNGSPVVVPASLLNPTGNVLVVKCRDTGVQSYAAFTLSVTTQPAMLGMNPAHILYDATTSTDGLSEPIGLINNASLTAGADTLFSEGFGLCTVYDPNTTPDIRDFMQRMVDIIGAGYSQSRVTGEYYLDLIRDDYVLGDLLVIGEDDVLSVSCQASVPTEAVNQVTVTWFDPEAKLERTTAPVKALGLIQASGKVIATNYQYQPIPSESLALRVAKRQLLALSTPLRRFDLVTNRIAINLRKGMAFRLDKPSEQIDDVVCRVVEIKHGTHENGRITLTVVEDIFSLPAATSITVGADPTDSSGSDTPADQPAAQLAFESPYLLLARQLSAADLAAVTEPAAYLATVATPPIAGALNYALNTAADGEAYVDRGIGYFCPSALIVEAATADPALVSFTLSGGYALDEVLIDTAALWGDEIVRIDAIDPIALTVTLGRACADTVPQPHAAGARIWFFDSDAANDGREYLEGELVHAKLLTRTSADELDLADAIAVDVTMAGRQARPYAPGQFAVNGSTLPTSESGTLTVTWAHRSRILEADQLLESVAAGVGPEPGTQYQVILKNNLGVVLHTSALISGASYAFTYTYSGTATLELKAIRGALESWQIHSRTFTYTGASTVIPPVTPGPSVALDPLDGTELVVIEQDGIEKECTAQAIADLANAYTDAKVAALSWKQAVRVATASAGALSSSFENGDTVDGVVLATGDRILIKDQAAGAENGIYVVAASGAPARASDADAGVELVGAAVDVLEGTANADKQFYCTTNAPITLGATALVFAAPSGGSSSVAADTHAASSKGTPTDADEFPLIDSAASWALKKLTWGNLKAALKTYFDGFYAVITASGAYSYTDATFANVSALLHFNGADNSTTFTDQISGNTWTANSTAVIKTAQSVYGGASGHFPSGANACISCPTNSKFDVGSGQWTIEFRYLYISTTADVARIFQTRNGDVFSGISMAIYSGTLHLSLSANGSSYGIVNGVVLADLGTSTTLWKEVLVERYIDSNTGQHYIFCSVDGVKAYEAPIASTACYYNSGDTVIIGGQTSGANRSACAYLEEFRFVKGQGLVRPNRLWPTRPAYADS